MLEKHYINKYFNGHRLTKQVYIDPNPLNLPPYTIRLKYTNGVTPVFSKGTAVHVSSSPNIWDLTYENSNWNNLLRFNLSPNNYHNELLEVLGANASGVTDMSYMFLNDSKLSKIAFFDTSSVTTMEAMFRSIGAQSDNVTIPLFDTSNVTNMMGMFWQAYIDTIPLFNTSKVTRTDSMFYASLIKDIPLLDLSKVTRAADMFSYCGRLIKIPDSLNNMSSLTEADNMFSYCTSLQDITLFDTSKLTDVRSMFNGCTNVKTGILKLYNQVSTQTNVPAQHQNMFKNCGSNTTEGTAALSQIPVYWGGTKS